MARKDYGFIRSYASLGRDLDDIQKFMAAGYGGVLIDYNDPYLAQAVNDLRGAGIPFGFWGDPNAVGNNDAAYVARMANLYNQYNPEVLVPDLEFAYRGDPGSAEWNKMEQLAALWQQYLPNARTAIAPMGSSHSMYNYNVKPWGPNTEWWPQAYGANSHTEWQDPRKIVENMIAAGVSPDMITPILADAHYTAGAPGGYGGSALWTLDDFIGRDYPKASGPAAQSPATGGSAARTTTTRNPYSYTGRNPGLSQSTQEVAAGGLRWGGKVYGSKEEFANYLKQRGSSYANWAANHAQAAAGLNQRKPNATGTRSK